eukprot:11187891-Alexandrium_andersonii.AAC.1
MSASLVGSEMCIRDRGRTARAHCYARLLAGATTRVRKRRCTTTALFFAARVLTSPPPGHNG